MTNLKYTIYFLLLLTSISCSRQKEGKTEAEGNKNLPVSDFVILNEAQFKTSGIETGFISLHDLSSVVKANGKLDVPPQNMVSISAPLGGFVKNTTLLQGMKVKKGQLLVEMESPDYIQLQQDYLDARSQLTFLEAEYERQQELAKENVNSTKTLQQVRANYQSTKAKTEALKAKLRLIHINPQSIEDGTIQSTISIPSPLEGFVTEVHVNIGSHVNPTDVMFEIIDTEHLHAEAEVFEKDVLKLKQGNKVRIRLANETQEREAKVYLIGKEISGERTVRIHCHLEKEDVNLLPGMYFSAIIETANQKLSALPESAFASYEGEEYIFIVTDKAKHEYKMIAVTRGTCESGFCEVTLPEGVDRKSEIVVKGSFELLSKLKNQGEEE